eukprot:jgi/Chrzof1/10888/Cz05g16010.t1
MAESAVTAKRNVLLTVDTTTASVQALQYAVHEIYRPGDVLHLLHVAPVLSPQYTIGHVAPQTTFDVPDPAGELDTERLQGSIKEYLRTQFVQYAEQRQIATCIHLYLETDNAPASAVGTIALRVAAEVGACLLIVCRPPEPEKGLLSKLTSGVNLMDYLNSESLIPVLTVGDYTPGCFDNQKAEDWLKPDP